MRRDNLVGIALGYGLDDWGSRVRFPAGAGNFSLHHRVQNGSGAHPASYSVGTMGSFPGSKAAGAWSWPVTSIYCRGRRMCGAIHPLRQYAFIVLCSVKKAQEQIILLLLVFLFIYCGYDGTDSISRYYCIAQMNRLLCHLYFIKNIKSYAS
jgi:hypothetical protein